MAIVYVQGVAKLVRHVKRIQTSHDQTAVSDTAHGYPRQNKPTDCKRA